jgi:hypothetical protein
MAMAPARRGNFAVELGLLLLERARILLRLLQVAAEPLVVTLQFR